MVEAQHGAGIVCGSRGRGLAGENTVDKINEEKTPAFGLNTALERLFVPLRPGHDIMTASHSGRSETAPSELAHFSLFVLSWPVSRCLD